MQMILWRRSCWKIIPHADSAAELIVCPIPDNHTANRAARVKQHVSSGLRHL